MSAGAPGAQPGQITRGTHLIRGAAVVSMDPATGDLPVGDILVVDGVIAQIGRDLSAPASADVIEAGGMLALPGFVETHWHMFASPWRGLAHDASQYMALQWLAAVATPEDHYAAVRYAATEAINAGITTCHDWAHLLRGAEDAEAEAAALVDSGIRARFGFGRLPGTGPVTDADLKAMQDWLGDAGDGRVDLGVVSTLTDHVAEDLAMARRHGVRTFGPHSDLRPIVPQLGPDLLFTHGPGTPDEFVRMLADHGVKVVLCPGTDPLIGAGLPPVMLFLDNGVPFEDISISVDVSAQASVDPFAAMRTVMNSARIAQQRGAAFGDIIMRPNDAEDPTMGLMMPRQVMQMATANGARALGLDDVTGRLTEGKRADLVLVRLDDLNMLPAPDTNPTFQVVQHAQPSNVDTVIIDGRVLKRGGRLIGVDVGQVVADAVAVQRRLRERSGASVDPAL
jgi:5-methylthioadenosine/S-adenosylhomocysteine deaminase